MKRKRPEDLTDNALMEEYKLGSSEAFEELYRRYSGKIYGYLQKKLGPGAATDDLFQETLLRLHKYRYRYDASRPLLPWLFTISHNALVDYLRKAETVRKLAVEAVALGQSSTLTQEPELSALSQGYNLLAEREQEVLRLRYGQDLGYDEISLRLSISSANARKIASRAVKKLRDFLK